MTNSKPLWAIVMGILSSLSFTSVQASGGDEHRKAPLDPLYVQECGSCHAPYPARHLSASSWQAIMQGLDKHFGSDASLDDQSVTKAIETYLLSQARKKETADASGHPILRITDTRWFKHEHDEIPASVWRSAAVKSPANCGACHTGTEQGRFSEHGVRIPQ